MLELTWDRVDLAGGMIHLGPGHGKKRRGIVPINDALRPYLLEAHKIATCPYVIEFGSGKVASIKKGFHAAAGRAGITGITPHSLRHTSVSWMILAGVPMQMAAKYASMSLQMAEKIYSHHDPNYLAPAARALAGKK